MILRRLYLYVVSAAALVLLAAGLALLGAAILMFVFNDPAADTNRGQLAIFTAMIVVALPVWAVHFWFARRFALHDPYERASALRRLYMYLACLVSALATTIALALTLSQILAAGLDNQGFNGETTAQLGWAALVFAAVFAFHFWIAAADRKAAGEEGASATLRRWYMYASLLVGLLIMLNGAANLLQAGLSQLALGHSTVTQFGPAVAWTVAGAVLWAFHARAIAAAHLWDDRHSTLRAVEGFMALAVSIATALFGASTILYYVLARLLGVSNPGGAGANLLFAASGPVSLVLVYGTAWFLLQRRLTRDAGTQEADRQAGVRRLYTNLTSLVSLAVLAVGAGGLLWTLVEQLEAPIIGVRPAQWQDPVSLWLTLLAVGAAVWAAHWRHAPWAADRQSLSRRLYVWAALLASILGVLAGGVGMVNALLQQLFSAHPTLQASSNLDVGHYLAVIVVAAAIGAYHWRVLRADAAARPPRPAAAAPPMLVAKPIAVAGAPATAPQEELGPRAHRYTLVVTDATDDDIHQALSGLPPQASYRLTSSDPERAPEHAVDGR